VTVTHDETRASVARTRRARRQLDDAATYLEVAAFAALMAGTAEDLARMTGCTEAITTLAGLGARGDVEAELAEGEDPVGAAVQTLRGISAEAFVDPAHAVIVGAIADSLARRFLAR
jgi:hypothetical protein